MAEFWGMDDEDVRGHAELMISAGERTEGLGERLRASVLAVTWVGPDADGFRDEALVAFDRLTQWGRDCTASARTLEDEAVQQDGASAGEGLAGLAAGALADAVAAAMQKTSAASASLALGLGQYDDPDDDIAPITEDDITRPEGDDLFDPTSVEDIVQNLQAVDAAQNDDATSIRVQAIVGPDGETRYVVYVPGSYGDPVNTVNPSDTGGNPMDWNQNSGALMGGETDSSQAVEAAMEAAGVPKGADVILAGHSQGGIVSTNLAASPDFNGGENGYHVTDVVTFGSPVENKFLPDGTNSINFANIGNGGIGTGQPFHPGDPVPILDEPFLQEGSPYAGGSDSHQEVGLDAPNEGGLFDNHGIGSYRESVHNATKEQQEIIEEYQNSDSMQNVLGGEESDTVDVEVSRDPSTY